MKYLIIDGYNAISKIKEFDAKKDISLQASRLAFIKTLMDFMHKKHIFNKIIVVFDGKGEDLGPRRESYGDVEVLFSDKDRDADKAIVDILKILAQKNKIAVSSDDNFVRNHVRAFGCEIMCVRELEHLINLKKKSPRSKIIEKDIEDSRLNAITKELKGYWGVK